VAIPLTSEFVPAPAALSDDDQLLVVELRESDPGLVASVREAEDSELERARVAAAGERKGKRAEYYCAGCGYGIVVYGQVVPLSEAGVSLVWNRDLRVGKPERVADSLTHELLERLPRAPGMRVAEQSEPEVRAAEPLTRAALQPRTRDGLFEMGLREARVRVPALQQ
jgi:hypothetical protein